MLTFCSVNRILQCILNKIVFQTVWQLFGRKHLSFRICLSSDLIYSWISSFKIFVLNQTTISLFLIQDKMRRIRNEKNSLWFNMRIWIQCIVIFQKYCFHSQIRVWVHIASVTARLCQFTVSKTNNSLG